LIAEKRKELFMLKKYSLKMPHAVYGGENAMENITAVIKKNGAKKVAMFTDKGIEASGLFALPEEAVRASGAAYEVLDDLPAEPSYMAVQKLVDRFKTSGADLIVACGGGSVMDAAKLASVLVTDEYGVKELLEDPGRAKKCVPIILIPTTAGTGAEVTPNAIVAVPEKELKVGIVNEDMIADYVILDARMIEHLPRKIAAATGVDALAHCIECYTGNKANPFSNLYALEGLDLILNNIEKACDDPSAMEEKNRMQIAAYYGGLAITASGTTAVHALSYPLGGKYHIAHGVSNAILLAPVMRFNSGEPEVRARLAVAYDRCCHGEKTCTTVDEKSAWIISRLEEIVKHLDIPTSLKEFGVPAEDLEGLVESGMQVQRLLVNNMRPVTPDDARKLYQEIL
jgi:alcohol dehydrogenase class IV